MLPIENEQFVAFEWIGQENYLKEILKPGQKRTRGANFTSADAAVMFQRKDGLKQIVLIEWKYSESYYGTPLHIARSGRDRTKIYRHLYERNDCPLNKQLLGSYDALFYEPFYQLMRQQFLANEMERAHELGADIVSLLHISPAHNHAVERITSEALLHIDEAKTVTDVWKKLVRQPDRFSSVHTETLFGKFPVPKYPALADSWAYLTARYPWFRDDPQRTIK